MDSDDFRSAAPIIGHPIWLFLVSFPVACFSGALATDIAYARSADMMWANFSAWLLAAGMLFGVLAALGGVVRLVAHRRLFAQRRLWPFAISSLLVLVLGFVDNLVHSRDAWTSVVPTGLVLSAVTFVAMLATILLGSAFGRRDIMSATRSREIL